jgi:cytochrome b561
VAAALFHALVRRDGVFDTMTTGPTYSKMPPTN